MSRPLRLDFPGALHHVVVRGNERRLVFRDDGDREQYLARLADYRERHRFRLYAYCLMDNHFHLAIGTGTVPLSRIMLAVQSAYTQAFNRRYRRSGHLFQGRYKAFLVEKDRYFLALLRYIHENPVKAGVVTRADRYRWSSDRPYRTGQGPEWLDFKDGLKLLDVHRERAVRRYQRLMSEELSEPYESVPKVAQLIKGDEAFAADVIRRAEMPELSRRRLKVEAVARLVAESRGVNLESLRGVSRARDASRARAIVGYLAKLHGRIAYSRTAEYFNRDGSTVSKDVRHFEQALRDSGALQREVAVLSSKFQG